ncbi:GNAT family N-acetyltransferase [Aquibacillus kalidii]|uniref:GNAT family N-acetyltransferase n=1 Tax=Aquibacillus kalidii TaxID=2762597 RepID=UPI001645B3F7|nr:GNAT family N-acetyltransferase [Aquibacillus kalidii]
MIRLATIADLESIMEIVGKAVKVMNDQGNFQWDHSYPLLENYQGDLEREDLYVYEKNEEVLGAIAISEKAHSEYHLIGWSSDEPALTLKRLVVSPFARKQGIADAFFEFAEEYAIANQFYFIKTDTFSKNLAAQKLFARNGYTFVEERREEAKNDSLYYFEKKLNA